MTCSTCGYAMQPLDSACPRCAGGAVSGGRKTQALPNTAGNGRSPAPRTQVAPPASPHPSPQTPPRTQVAPPDSYPQAPPPAAYSPPPLLGDGWFYAAAGRQVGPIIEAHLPSLVARGAITAQTLVWKYGMANWQEARFTALAMLLAPTNAAPGVPAPIPAPAPYPPSAPYPAPAQAHYPTPFPTPGTQLNAPVNNTVVWVLAFVSILADFFVLVLADFLGLDKDTASMMRLFMPLFMNVCLSALDTYILKNEGRDLDGLSGWMFFLVPVYLFKRAALFRHSNAYAWVWVVMFCLSLSWS